MSTSTEAPRSEAYHGDDCLLREIRMVGRMRPGRDRANTLRPHMHARAYEICYVADGQAEWWVENEICGVRRGQFYLTRPEELHGGVATSSMPDDFYWIQVSILPGSALEGLSVDETECVRAGLDGSAARVIDAEEDVSPPFDRILETLRSPSGELSRISLRAALHEILVRVALGVSKPSSPRVSDPGPAVRVALAWMESHLGDEYSVEEVASVVGIAPSYLHKLFAREMGVTPGAYRARRRVAAAKQRLTQGAEPIARVAHDLGFTSSQYFATVFRELTGMTPSRYRAWSRQADPLGRPVPEYVD